jgi:Tol biopolymer transport system component
VRDRQLGITRRISISSSEVQATDGGASPTISADGRYVAFASLSGDLVANDTNAAGDVFVRDRQLGTTRRVSISSAEGQGNSYSYSPASISADGRYVAFYSSASDLVANDTNGAIDVFVRDRQQGTTRRVSVGGSERQANRGSFLPSISADGRDVAFASVANNLVAHDTNRREDVFVRGPLQ